MRFMKDVEPVVIVSHIVPPPSKDGDEDIATKGKILKGILQPPFKNKNTK